MRFPSALAAGRGVGTGFGTATTPPCDSRSLRGRRFWPSYVQIDGHGVMQYTGCGTFPRDDADVRT